MNALYLIYVSDQARVGIRNTLRYIDVPDFFVNINSCSWDIGLNPPEQKFDHLLFFSTLAVNGIKFFKQFHISLSFNKSLLHDFNIKGQLGLFIYLVVKFIAYTEENLTVHKDVYHIDAYILWFVDTEF